jgi:quinol monooxygenase YgiN
MRSFCRVVLLGLAMSALGVTVAGADDPTTLYTATYIEVVPPATAQAAALLRQYRQASAQAAGNLRVEVLQRIDRPNQFVVLAAWKDQKALEANPAVAVLREALRPLLASPNDERLHQALTVGAPGSAPGAVYAVTHVDVIPPRKDDAVALLTRLAEASRKDAGNVRFDVVQQTSRPNHFTVVEVWKDRPAFDAHGMAAPTRQFRDSLGPMSGALYDERLYGALD